MKVECPCGESTARYLNTNPALSISEIPDGTVSMVLIAENPDTVRFHWVVYNVPVTDIVEENFRKGTNAVNDFARHDFTGPDPDAEYRETPLVFNVFALDVVLNIGGGKGGNDILRVMRGHILDHALVEYHYNALNSNE